MPDAARLLIITNGDSAASLLMAAGETATILPWRDVLHIGPVPMTGSAAELSEIRSQALVDFGLTDQSGAQHEFGAREEVLRQPYDTVELWFEHDLYDQLQLLQVLDHFASDQPIGCPLHLVQAGTYLTDHSPETILGLRSLAIDVSPQHLSLATSAWTAFRQPSPTDFASVADTDTSLLPHLRAAVVRALEELPHTRTGVSRSQLQMLQAISDGADTPRTLFPAATARDQARFMGDLIFWHLLEQLAFADEPLVAGLEQKFNMGESIEQNRVYLSRKLTLTGFGQQVLSGEADHASRNHIDMWLGGTHVTQDNLWRWNSADQSLQRPE